VLRVPEPVAEAKLHTATELVDRFPATLAALRVGNLGLPHANILIDATTGIADEVAAAVEARVLPRAANQTAAAYRRSVARAVTRLAPQQAEERHAQARAERNVTPRPLPDGMGGLTAVIPADDLAAVMGVLNRMAKRRLAAGDLRSIGQLRADTLVDRVLARTTTGSAADGSVGRAVAVGVDCGCGAGDGNRGARADHRRAVHAHRRRRPAR